MPLFRILDAIVLIAITVSAVNVDALTFSDDDSLISDTGLLSTDDVLGYSQPDLPLGSDSSAPNEPDPLFENRSFDLAACSSSETFPVVGKPRIRRRDTSGVCSDSDTTPPKSQVPIFESDHWDTYRNLGRLRFQINTAAGNAQKQNGACRALTQNVLPWGVCYAPMGMELPLTPAENSHSQVPYPSWDLDPCTLAPGFNALCNPDEEFYCCFMFLLNDVSSTSGLGRGFTCVKMSIIMG